MVEEAVLSVVPGTEVAADAPLMEAGLDSLGAAELVNVLNDRFGIRLPSTVLFDSPTLDDIVLHIVGELEPDPQGNLQVVLGGLRKRVFAIQQNHCG